MKTIFILFIATAFNIAHAAPAQQDWFTANTKHPLWDVMKGKVKTITEGSKETQIKKAGGVTCTRIALLNSNPLASKQAQYTCVFPTNMDNKQVLAFYKALNVKPTASYGAFLEIKVVDKMIVVADSDTANPNSRVYLAHACQSVNSSAEASDCMNFWAAEILPSYEGENTVALIEATTDKKAMGEKFLKFVNPTDLEAFTTLNNSDFIGIVGQHRDEEELYWFSVQAGQNVTPKEITSFGIPDLAYNIADEIRDLEEEEREKVINESLEALIFGNDDKLFSDAVYGLKEDIENTLAE